jgi:hypothetical protein
MSLTINTLASAFAGWKYHDQISITLSATSSSASPTLRWKCGLALPGQSQYFAGRLPRGLYCDEVAGTITGRVEEMGTFSFNLVVGDESSGELSSLLVSDSIAWAAGDPTVDAGGVQIDPSNVGARKWYKLLAPRYSFEKGGQLYVADAGMYSGVHYVRVPESQGLLGVRDGALTPSDLPAGARFIHEDIAIL